MLYDLLEFGNLYENKDFMLDENWIFVRYVILL